jgi:hypothetical protein
VLDTHIHMVAYTSNVPWSFGPFDWITATEAAQIDSSRADVAQRPIGITAFIEDPRARTPHTWVKLPNTTEYHLKVDNGTVDIWVRGNSDGLMNSLVLGTFAQSPSEALSRCGSLLFSLLSSWSFQAQRPFAVRELLVEDKLHQAKWQVRPQAQTPVKLNDITVSLAGPNPIGSLLALFREGMASTQPGYRFLCFYKIIEAWKEHHGPFKQVNQAFAVQGKVPKRRVLKVEDDMFSGKCEPEKYQHLIGKKFGWCFEKMNDARRFLAHPFSSEGEFVSLDSPETIQALSDTANIAERMAIEILVDEIRVVQSLDSSGTTDRVIAGYIHETWGRDLLQS